MEKGNINFSNFNIKPGYISFDYQIEKVDGGRDENTIYFELTPSIIPSGKLIATALSTLCHKVYGEINIDLKLSKYTIEQIEKFTDAKVSAVTETNLYEVRKSGNSTTLNFSGGFDSLAARSLMPEDTKLVSMDFGGLFSRERAFFEKFNPCIVSTNLLETPLRYNNWSFMGIASILFSEHLNTGYHTFGSILEAGPNNFSDDSAAARNISFPPFKMVGIENAPYVLGLTEIGTLSVLGHHSPDLISESLDSLANPGEEKRYRKQVLTRITENRMGVDFGLNQVNPPRSAQFNFGQNFALDFLSLYTIKHAGLEIASHTINDIPDEAIELANTLNLDFYNRINTNYLVNFPKPLLKGLMTKLSEADVLPYSQKDWMEYFEVRKYLSNFYKFN